MTTPLPPASAATTLLPQLHRLHDEITFLELRLEEMGHAGDCAYEQALSRAYVQRLAERRRELAGLLH